MASEVNWGLPQLQSPAPQIASISELLGSIADAREKRRQFEEQQAELARHHQMLEQYNQEQLAQNAAISRAKMMQAAQKMGIDRQNEANKHMDAIKGLVASGDLQGAQEMGGQYGVGVSQNQDAIDKAALAARVQRGTAAADAFSSIPGMPAPVSAAFGDNARQGTGIENTPEELHPKVAPVKFDMPAGPVLDYDPQASEKALLQEKAKQQLEFMQKNQAGMGATPIGQQTMTEVGNMIGDKNFKEDPYKIAQELITKREQSAEAMKRAQVFADARNKEKPPNPLQEQKVNQTGYGRVQQDLKTYDPTTMRKLLETKQDLTKATILANSDNAPEQAAAIEEYLKKARGGMITAQNMKFGMGHMGGVIDRAETALRAAVDGGFGEGVMNNLRAALGDVQGALNQDVEEIHQGFVDRFYGSGQYEGFHDNIDNFHAGLFGPFGYKTDRHPNTPGMSPTGKPYNMRAGGGAPQGKAGATLINAAPGAGGGDDDMMVVPGGGLPPASAMAGSGGGPGGPGDPALMDRHDVAQIKEKRDAAKAAGASGKRKSIEDWVREYSK